MVTVTKEEAHALDFAIKRTGYSIENLLRVKTNPEEQFYSQALQPLNDMDFETYAKAVVTGEYEVQVPEEHVELQEYVHSIKDKIYFSEHEETFPVYDQAYEKGKLVGVANTLHILGIEIKGINA